MKRAGLRLAVEDARGVAESAFGALWKGIESPWDALEAQVRWVDGYRALRMERAKLELASNLKDSANLGAFAKKLAEAMVSQLTLFESLTDTIKIDIKIAFAVESIDAVPFAQMLERLQRWSVCGDQLTHWVNYHNASEHIAPAPCCLSTATSFRADFSRPSARTRSTKPISSLCYA